MQDIRVEEFLLARVRRELTELLRIISPVIVLMWKSWFAWIITVMAAHPSEFHPCRLHYLALIFPPCNFTHRCLCYDDISLSKRFGKSFDLHRNAAALHSSVDHFLQEHLDGIPTAPFAFHLHADSCLWWWSNSDKWNFLPPCCLAEARAAVSAAFTVICEMGNAEIGCVKITNNLMRITTICCSNTL